MKAFPLIFSRTKNEDFVPDFLVRPADLDVKETQKYVHDAMQGLDTLNSIRYTAFAAGSYCICGGIACLSKQLVQKAGVASESAAEYLKDCKGRSLACFVGFAIPMQAVTGSSIPILSLETYWSTYLEFLKHQWEALETHSEQLSEPYVDLPEKSYTSNFKPATEMLGGRAVIRRFEENAQQILDYYFNALLNLRQTDASFISDVLYRDEWDQLYFKNAAVSEQLYMTLKTSPAPRTAPVKPSERVGVSQQGKPDLGIKTFTEKPAASSYVHANQNRRDDPGKKKTAASYLPFLVAGAVLLIIIVLLIVRRGR